MAGLPKDFFDHLKAFLSLIGGIDFEYRQSKFLRRISEQRRFIFLQINREMSLFDQNLAKVVMDGAVVIDDQDTAVVERIDVHHILPQTRKL